MKKLFFLMLFAFFFTISCKKETPPEIDVELGICDVEVIRTDSNIRIPLIYGERIQYKLPYFNPNNANEIIYYYVDNKESKNQLIKHNLITNESLILVDGVRLISQPKWSKKGWIAFDNIDYHIYKVRDDGNSLTRITNEGFNGSSVWNASGDDLIWLNTEWRGGPGFTLKKGLNQTIIDTIHRGGLFGIFDSVSEDDKLFHGIAVDNIPYMGYYDLSKEGEITDNDFNIIMNVNQYIGHGGASGVTWGKGMNKGKVYFTRPDGLFELDTQIKSVKKIKDLCTRLRYESISCSPDGKHIVAGRFLTYNLGTNEVTRRYDLVLLDLNTLEETKIEL